MPTTDPLVCAGFGAAVVRDHRTASYVPFFHMHTRRHRRGCSGYCKSSCSEGVAKQPGLARLKRVLQGRARETTKASDERNQVRKTCRIPEICFIAPADPDPFPIVDPHSLHNLPGAQQSVHHVWLSPAALPPSVAVVDPVHTRSDCL
jgi:hypothetical protein